jgi:two-component system response regulator YesN
MDVDGVSSALDELERLIREQTPAPGSARQALLELSVAVDHAFAGDLASRDSVIAAETANRLPTLRELVDAIREQATTLAGRIGAKWGLRTELLSDWLLRYMRGHYNEQLTLRSIADLVNLNPVYLGQRFRSETGKSFHDALLEVRMAVASQALASSDTPVHVIAEQVGYLAPVNFYKGFKKVYGVSPAKYRQRKATEENQL